MANVGKYTIHGCYGMGEPPPCGMGGSVNPWKSSHQVDARRTTRLSKLPPYLHVTVERRNHLSSRIPKKPSSQGKWGCPKKHPIKYRRFFWILDEFLLVHFFWGRIVRNSLIGWSREIWIIAKIFLEKTNCWSPTICVLQSSRHVYCGVVWKLDRLKRSLLDWIWLICWFCCQTSKKCLGWFWCKCDQWPMPSIVEDVIGRLTSCNNFNRRLWPNMKNLEETTFVSNRHVIALLLTICFLHWLRSFGTWFWLTLLSKHSNVW